MGWQDVAWRKKPFLNDLMPGPSTTGDISLYRVLRTWWPLALSWLLMTAEPAALTAVVARLPDPQINLAAYGSVASPLIGILQAPILTLLSVSTSLSKDWDSYRKGRRLMFLVAGSLTLLYIIVVFSPLYYVVVENIIGAPAEIIEPARTCMMLGVPWTFAVAYRRFHQGVLIRFDHSRSVTMGTILRFIADAIVLTIGYLIGSIPGAIVATIMMLAGVTTDAVYVGRRVQPVLQNEVKPAPPPNPPLSVNDLILFYLPLAVTPFLNMLIRPIGSAALSRMPDPLLSLAIYPVLMSLSNLVLTVGWSYNEVVNALIDQQGAKRALMRFAAILITLETSLMVLIAATPLAKFWFGQVSGLDAESAHLASQAFWFLIPLGILSPIGSMLSGAILHSRKTRGITEGMAIYLIVFAIGLWLGGNFLQVNGLYVVVCTSVLSSMCQIGWLWIRGHKAFQRIQ